MRLNYCREYLRWMDKNKHTADICADYAGINLERVKRWIARSEKFILPDGGCLVGDEAVVGLDDADLIRLPYTQTVLEYCATPCDDDWPDDLPCETSKKRIIMLEDHGDNIYIQGVWDHSGSGVWEVSQLFTLSKTDIARSTGVGSAYLLGYCSDPDHPCKADIAPGSRTRRAMEQDIRGEICVVMRFVAALACSNVNYGAVTVPKAIGRKKTPYPYDSYHQLLVRSGANRSGAGAGHDDRRGPREHLRRGHIRRLPSGGRIWINSMLVNPGVGGKITKEYAIA